MKTNFQMIFDTATKNYTLPDHDSYTWFLINKLVSQSKPWITSFPNVELTSLTWTGHPRLSIFLLAWGTNTPIKWGLSELHDDTIT